MSSVALHSDPPSAPEPARPQISPTPDLQPEQVRLRRTQPDTPASLRVLTPDAMAFLGELAGRFAGPHAALLQARKLRQHNFDRGALPGFLPETQWIRESAWQVAPIPAEVQDRRTEITGPVSRKMVINALNSTAQVYMADFEDSTSPSWHNLMTGQVNLMDAVRRQIDFTSPEGKRYALRDETAVLMVRPRGLHLPERHLRMGSEATPASLVDFGLFLFHNHAALQDAGSRPYFYLPKIEHHEEAIYWNDVMGWAEERLGLEKGTVKATVLIETLPAAFQMHEILHALRERILGLNCGRWDYIFSYIKTFRAHADRMLPDRAQVTMDTPFLSAYSRLLIQSCHERGAFAMGGMAAQIPIRGDEQANEVAMGRVRADKEREASNGHDGTWVAHPGLEPLARAAFDAHMPGPNQLAREPDAAPITETDLLDPCAGSITEAGICSNIRVAILYLSAWLEGNGCVPIDHLMEDAATAEISRAQLWHWLRHQAQLDDGSKVTRKRMDDWFTAEHRKLLAKGPNGHTPFINRAAAMLRQMTQQDEMEPFLTLPAYRTLMD